MKNILFILIILSIQLSCDVQECHCELHLDEIEEINSKLSIIKEGIGFHDFEQIEYGNKSIIREYNLKFSHPILSYEKNYKIVGEIKSPFIETTLSKKYIENKRVKHETLRSNSINISTREWTQIDELINQSCFWTKPVIQETNIRDSILYYSLEGIDLKRNICSNNTYHQIIRNSARNEDVKDIINQILKFETTSDLDSLIRNELSEMKNK